MVKYKIIEMVDGKVTFTKEELEDLLEEVYQEGKSDGASKTPPLWNPGVREIDATPTCLGGTITFNGEEPKMMLYEDGVR